MTPDEPSVRVVALHPRDPASPTSGGIQTFLRDFVGYSPDDFSIAICGVTSDARERPVGRWHRVEIGGRVARFLPLAEEGVSLARPSGLPRLAQAMLRFVRARSAGTILQLHRPYRSFVSAGHRGPRVQFVHVDIDHWPGPQGWHRLRSLYREINDGGLGQMDRVFVANESGARRLRAEHPDLADRIEFLPGWYDDRTFRPPSAAERDAARARLLADLALPAEAADERFVLLVGRLEEVKDPILALDTFARLLRTDDASAHLVIVGSGELSVAIENRIAEQDLHGRVHLAGERAREDVAQMLQAADALLLTSVSEGGGPRVVLEALGSGLPVVATVVGEVGRVVKTGENGWLAADREPEALAQGLRWVLGHPYDSLVTAAVRAARPFTAGQVLPPLYETYRSLAEMARR